MAITVAMIEEKEFKTKMRGYDPIEVDEFLDDICDEMVALQEEIATLNQRLSQQNQQSVYAPAPAPVPAPAVTPVPAPAATPIPAPIKVEEPKSESSEAAQKLLAKAQKLYDETLADAKQEAEEILEDARQKAAEQIGDLEGKRDALLKEVEDLKASAQDYRERFLRLVEDQQHILKSETALFE